MGDASVAEAVANAGRNQGSGIMDTIKSGFGEKAFSLGGKILVMEM
jgi:hypothetical protein